MAAKLPFNLYQRKTGIWYIRFKNPDTGKWTGAKSSGETDRDLATAWAYHAIKYGIPEKGGRTAADVITLDSILTRIRNAERLDRHDAERILSALRDRGLVVSAAAVAGSEAARDTAEFLESFWTWDFSPYIREKLSRGQTISKQHAANRLSWIRKYWTAAFRGTPLVELTRAALREFAVSLADTPLAAQTRNHVLLAGTVALRWAYHNEIIPSDLTAGLKSYSGDARKRGTLTMDEADRLFNRIKWPDERVRLANLTAALSGLRSAEVAALRLQDIGEDRLFVRHSWCRSGALKSTKTGETREVPILPALRDALRELAGRNPHGVGPGTFVFWNVDADRPLPPRTFTEGLREALLRLDGFSADDIRAEDRVSAAKAADRTPDPIDIATAEKVADARRKWSSRNVVFHSWRHFYSATLAGRLDARTVMHATGHRSESVFAQYSDHVNAERFERVAAASGETFGQILQFRGGKDGQ